MKRDRGFVDCGFRIAEKHGAWGGGKEVSDQTSEDRRRVK